MTRRLRGLIVAIIAVLVICACGVMLAAVASADNRLRDVTEGAIYSSDYFKPKSEKAMLLIPGLMASTLYDPNDLDKDGNPMPVWGMEGFVELVIKVGDSTDPVGFLMDLLASDSNNVPNTKLIVGTMDHKYDQYGSFQGMQGLHEYLHGAYGKQYDVITWQYDWRQHNMGSAEQLELFINTLGYKEVMFFTHSMGGVVVANYLSRSEENREKTKLFCPAGAPFFGSMDATLNLLNNELRPPATGLDINNIGVASIEPLINSMLQKIEEDTGVASDPFRLYQVTRTFAPVFQLLPFAQYNDSAYFDSASGEFVLNGVSYEGDASSIIIDGKGLSPADVIEWLKTQEWAVKPNGKLQPVILDLVNYRNNMFFEKDGKTVFVSELVPTEYVIGLDHETVIGVGIRGSDSTIIAEYKSLLGDGTVPAYSATAGLPIDHERVHTLPGIFHGPLWDDKPTQTFGKEQTGLKFLPTIMPKYIKNTDAELGL